MRLPMTSAAIAAAMTYALMSFAIAADYPTPKDGEWIVRDLNFHSGEVLPELRLLMRNRSRA